MTRPEIWSKIKATLQETQQENDKHNVLKNISQRSSASGSVRERHPHVPTPNRHDVSLGNLPKTLPHGAADPPAEGTGAQPEPHFPHSFLLRK